MTNVSDEIERLRRENTRLRRLLQLTGDIHIGLYPMLPGDQTCWLAADFDGPAAMLDDLAHLKAARALEARPRRRSPARV